MAYLPPGIEEFFERYPEFASFDESTVEIVLGYAIAEVGERWISRHRIRATLALAAHKLFIEHQSGLGESSTSALSGGTTSGPITSETVGPLSVRYTQRTERLGGSTSSSGASGSTDILSSPYGREFDELSRLSFPAVAIV